MRPIRATSPPAISHHIAKTFITGGATGLIEQPWRPSATIIATGGGGAPDGHPTRHTAEKRTNAPTTTREIKPPLIIITIQDPKDTVTLIEKVSNIKQFHLKRIHTANTTFYTYTPKTEKHHTYMLKGLDNSYTETEILTDLQSLQIDDIQFTKKKILNDKITSFKILETTIIKIKISNKGNLFITAAYATYGNRKEFSNEFNKLFELLQLNKPENYYIIAGDLNAKHTSWKNEINNTRDNFIRNWLDNKSVHFKTNLYSSELPSYPKGGSYLDICLADARLKFQNLRPNNTLKTLDYDSDHNALVFQINKNTSDFLILETQTETPRYNYKKVDWKKFQNLLEQNCDLKIYNNVNLTNRQIDSFIDEIEKHTQIALQKSVPNIKQKNSCVPYINNKIKELQRDKSYILPKINNIKYDYSYDKREELEFLKYLLYKIKAHLKQEFANSINHYWTNKIKNISKNDTANMFPQINQIFRPKGQNPIPPLKLLPEKAFLIQEAGITTHNTIKDT
ncbi:uncharacterized protein [Bombus flavifrons]|uniref:uncharacterized protein n=1 Tax=Bombus flavifrons TaxID=103934 RepID=UPI003703D55C